MTGLYLSEYIFFQFVFEWACQDFYTVHAASRYGTPSLTSLPKDDEVSCEVRP